MSCSEETQSVILGVVLQYRAGREVTAINGQIKCQRSWIFSCSRIRQ